MGVEKVPASSMAVAHAIPLSKSVEGNHAQLVNEAASPPADNVNAALSRHIAVKRGAQEESEASSGTMNANASLNNGSVNSRNVAELMSQLCSKATVSAC